jgi:hypothetical protein
MNQLKTMYSEPKAEYPKYQRGRNKKSKMKNYQTI